MTSCYFFLKTHRPLEVEGEEDGVEVGHVVAQDGGGGLAEGALVPGLHLLLVVLEAHPEADPAGDGAPGAGRGVPGAAVAGGVAAARVLKVPQPDLEHALALGGRLKR